MRRQVVVAEWVGLVTLGTAVGVIAAVELLAIAFWRFFGIAGVPSVAGVIAMMFFAGAAHGATVGLAQSLLLRKVAGIGVWSWTLATAIAAGVAWAAGMGVNIGVANETWTPGKIALAIGAGGASLGAIVGTTQWALLRRHAVHCGTWIPANAAAAVAGLAAMWTILARIPANVVLRDLLLYGIAAGAATGLAIGAITAVSLALLQPRSQRLVT